MICRYHNIDCDNANENGYCKTSACVNPKFVVTIYPYRYMEHYVGDKSKEFHFEESRWHIGTPTEIGFYLVTTSYENYFVRFFNGVNFYRHPRALKIIAWQKIEPYKED